VVQVEDAIGIENNITTKARMRSPFASSLSFSWLYSSPCFFFLNLPAVNRPTIEVKIAVALVDNGATSAVFGTTLFSFSLVFSFVFSVVYPLFVEELAL